MSIGRGPNNLRILIGPKVKPKNTKITLSRLWSYLGRKNKALFLVLILVIISTMLGLAGPYLIGLSIDTMDIGAATVDFERLRILTMLMLSTYLISAIITWLQMHLMVGIAQRTIRTIRRDIFHDLHKLPLRYFETKTHGELMSRLTNDVENINQSLTQSIIQLFTSIVTVIGVLVIIIAINPFLALLSFITIPISIYITKAISKRTRIYFAEQQKELGNLNGYIEENITGLKVVKAFGQEQNAIEKFNVINSRLRKSSIKAQIYSGMILPLMSISNNLTFAMLAGVGGVMGARGIITIGTIAMFVTYSRIFTRPITEMANQFNIIQSAIAGAERIFEVMDEALDINENPHAKDLGEVNGEVKFQNVSFSYRDNVSVLQGVDIFAKPGQKIALVGETGAGKTTIVNLLMGFYEPRDGKILIDGIDISEVTKKSLRKTISMVLQDTYLFSGTIMENIRYGNLEATDEAVRNAAKQAKAESFILKLSQGYETNVTEGGNSLSIGQKQLLTIARAILANPTILILDEATSSVDTRTEREIQEALNTLIKGKTSFIIAHRLSTIRDADQILLIDDGQIVESGSHDELISFKGLYFNLYNSQFQNNVS